MASTTTNMGLIRWDSVSDYFSHQALAANFTAIDTHDHTTGKGVPIQSGGLANGAVTTNSIASLAVTNDKIAASTIADAKLASPGNGVWRRVVSCAAQAFDNETAGLSPNSVTAGSKIFSTDAYNETPPPNFNVPSGMFRYVATDYAVAGKTTQFRVGGSVGANATAAACSFTFNLHPLSTYSGATDAITFTFGAATGSATILASSHTSSIAHATPSSAFTLVDGTTYLLGVNISGSVFAADAAVHLFGWLEMRHV
jgi:hypothetical protein